MSKFSRRSLVTTAAVAAIAPALPAAASAVTRSDTERPQLLALGEQLMVLRQQMLEQTANSEKDDDRHQEIWDDFLDRLSAIARPILAFTAKSPAGIAIQATAASMAAANLWEPIEIEQEDPLGIERRFIEAICRHVGVTPYFLEAYAPTKNGAGDAAAAPVATEADPIFAAIERHRRACGELEKNCSRLDQLKTAAAKRELEKLHEAVDECIDDLVTTKPMTFAGVIALLRYTKTHEEGGMDWPIGAYSDDSHVSWYALLQENIAEALPQIVAAA